MSMLKVILLKLWPALIPLGFYFVWVLLLSRRVKDGRTIAEHVRRGMLFWAIMTSVALLIGALIWWGVSRQSNADGVGTYVPPHVENGALVPGHFKSNHAETP